MNITIHCTRQQVSNLITPFGKIILHPSGLKIVRFPEWCKRMYHAAKIFEHTVSYHGNRMRTYHSHSQVIKNHK